MRELRLERLLLEELAQVWQSYNQLYLRGALTPPVLALSDGTANWGAWQRRTRTLSLSRVLVWEHPWGEVCEVLKHEMAHQFAHEVLGATEERPHGPAFAEACKRLDVSSRASGALHGESNAPRADVVGKIRKLLALAGSSNEHEAEAAMRAAHRLMRRHNIDDVQRTDRPFSWSRVGPEKQRFEAWEKIRAGLLSRHYFVQAVWVRTWVVARGAPGRQLELVGEVSNLELAAWVHDFLGATGARLWREHRRQHRLPGNKLRARYLAGVMTGFDEKLSDEGRRCEEAGLVWVGDPELHDAVGRRFPRLRRGRGVRVQLDEVFGQGREAGRDIVVHRPVTETSKGPVRRLEGG